MNISDILGKVVSKVKERYGINMSQTTLSLDVPPNPNLGDFCVRMFPLAQVLKMNPAKIAGEIAGIMKDMSVFETVTASGPYLNLRLSRGIFFEAACKVSCAPRRSNGRKVMVEYLSPNTNKPLHLGHVRNGVLGSSVANLLKWAGYSVLTANLINDRGVHICKSMVSWKRFSEGKTPESEGKKGDHFVGDYYVRYAEVEKGDESMEEEAMRLLRLWEDGDSEVRELWKTMNEWVYAGFEETYRTYGLYFDVMLYESETYMLGKDIIRDGLKRGIFKTDAEERVFFPLPKESFGEERGGRQKAVTVLRGDGTSVYITQDLGTALMKFQDYGLDSSVYVVGSEQEYHFQCLFHILRSLGYDWADRCFHLSYGMVELPDGKMKSREGRVVDADDLAAEVIGLAEQEVRAREAGGVENREIADRARKIGLGAIKFYLAQSNPKSGIRFNPEESVSFDGVTGPYCQYACTRISSLLEKYDESSCLLNVDYSKLGANTEERVLAQKLLLFEKRIVEAAGEYDPSKVTQAVYELAKAFNKWYNLHRINDAEDPEGTRARLALARSVSVALCTGLKLLGIEVPDRM